MDWQDNVGPRHRTNQEDLIEVIQNLSSSRGEVLTIMETWTSQIHEYKTIIEINTRGHASRLAIPFLAWLWSANSFPMSF